jgi:pilus assembly protein CpaC
MGMFPKPKGSGRGRPGSALLALAMATFARDSAAQEGPPPPPVPAPPISGFSPTLPTLPTARDLPAASSLIDGLGDPVGALEVKVGQGRFVVLREDLVVPNQPAPFIAVGDPTVADFYQVGPRQLRLIGKRLGATDLSVTTGSGKTYAFEVQVVADLDILRVQLKQMFPDASLKLAQVRSKVVVEGQARGATEVARIISTIDSYMRTIQAIQISGQVGDVVRVENPDQKPLPVSTPAQGSAAGASGQPPATFTPTLGGTPVSGGGANGPTPVSPGAIASNSIATGSIQVINLIRVPTSQQVLLKVRVAELNRTAYRQIGADFVASIPGASSLFGSSIAGNGFTGALGTTTFPYKVGSTLTAGTANGLSIGSQGTFFGTFSAGNFVTVLDALRRNGLVKILAEPNLIALNGYQANFLAGGQFPVPIAQGGSVGGNGAISVQFKDYGVRLAFLPLIQDDDVIRLTVDPEVSTIDYSVGTTLVPGGSPIPGLNTRTSHTTVELKQGETLAIAGLMQLSLSGQTQRIPILGDLPYIGAFFSNTTNARVEKELVVLVTPYLVEPMSPGQVPAGPGDEVREPNDLEFFLMNRIEGRTGIDKRSTTSYDDPLHLIRHSIVEKKYLIGPSGYSQ